MGACLKERAVVKHTLMLMRHAEAAWGQSGIADHDRPLTPKGLQDAKDMGQHLAQVQQLTVQSLFHSSAARAKQTTAQVTPYLNLSAQDVHEKESLYLASPAVLLQHIRMIPHDVYQVAIVAHNPGLVVLAESLTQCHVGSFLPCSVVIIDFQLRSWKEVMVGQGKILEQCPRPI